MSEQEELLHLVAENDTEKRFDVMLALLSTFDGVFSSP